MIGLLLYESTGFYFATGNLNDDLSPKSELYGAYDVYLFTDNGKIIPASMSYPGRFRRVFFHRRDYFIVQTMDDKFIDYNVLVDKNKKTYSLQFRLAGTSLAHFRINLSDSGKQSGHLRLLF
ncbi:MAG: hypothetical protein IPG07_06770 [Crocinitomicaceae bacterium]|nr:hypothetical protein [Crocinitomicaceae bacterium]